MMRGIHDSQALASLESPHYPCRVDSVGQYLYLCWARLKILIQEVEAREPLNESGDIPRKL